VCSKKIMGLATIVYYRRWVLARPVEVVTLGVLPLGAAAFLGWILVRSVQTAPAPQNWSLASVLVVGVALMLLARYGLRSRFFGILCESDPGRTPCPARPGPASHRCSARPWCRPGGRAECGAADARLSAVRDHRYPRQAGALGCRPPQQRRPRPIRRHHGRSG
jgi:hypothetical protein